MLDSHVRAGLERRPQRKAFDADEAWVTGALASKWREAGYLFPGRDGEGVWWAFRTDGQAALRGKTPDELDRAVAADADANPVRPR